MKKKDNFENKGDWNRKNGNRKGESEPEKKLNALEKKEKNNASWKKRENVSVKGKGKGLSRKERRGKKENVKKGKENESS